MAEPVSRGCRRVWEESYCRCKGETCRKEIPRSAPERGLRLQQVRQTLSLPDWPPVTRTRSRAPRCLSVVETDGGTKRERERRDVRPSWIWMILAYQNIICTEPLVYTFITHLRLFNQSQPRILLVIMLVVNDSRNSVVIQICTILTVYEKIEHMKPQKYHQ